MDKDVSWEMHGFAKLWRGYKECWDQMKVYQLYKVVKQLIYQKTSIGHKFKEQ